MLGSGVMADDPKADDPKVCFIVSPIGEAGSLIRKQADTFLEFIVEPAIKDSFKPVRADKISDPGIITTQVIRHLLEAPLVIADLTGHNPNVMYELALRHAVAKPFIQLITKGQSIPFDVGHQRTIPYDLTDPYSVRDTIVALAQAVDVAMAPDFKPETPIGHAVRLGALGEGTSTEKVLGELIARFDSLEGAVLRSESQEQQRRAAEAAAEFLESVKAEERTQQALALGYKSEGRVSIIGGGAVRRTDAEIASLRNKLTGPGRPGPKRSRD